MGMSPSTPLANDQMPIVARFFFFREVARGGFPVARSGSRRLVVAFLSSERLGAFFCLRVLSQTMLVTDAVNVLR